MHRMHLRLFIRPPLGLVICLIVGGAAGKAQAPTRDPHAPGYVQAKELADGELPPADADGNFILGPTHRAAIEATTRPDVPHGTVRELTMKSANSKIYPGIARDAGTFGTPDSDDPSKMIVTTSHPAPYTRHVAV